VGGPYREDKSLGGLIAPDRRKLHAVMFIGGGMLIGAALLHFGGRLFDSPPRPDATPSASASGSWAPPLAEAEVESFVREHAADIRRACWTSDPGEKSRLGTGALSVTLTIAPSGIVESVAPGPSMSNDPESSTALLELQNCVERQVRGWRFRRTAERVNVRIPLRFER
jgi:hypothetical protein